MAIWALSRSLEIGRRTIPFLAAQSVLRDGGAAKAEMPKMKVFLASWQFWALLSAGFAALTAIFGKIGVENIDSSFATLIRTCVILVVAAGLVLAMRSAQPLSSVSPRTWLFLILSGIATGASWLCYYRALQLGPAARVAPVDKLSVVLVAVLGVALLGEHLGPKSWLGVGLIAAGAMLVAFEA
jgi:transporter family protein